jgi:hypothetical protein
MSSEEEALKQAAQFFIYKSTQKILIKFNMGFETKIVW